MRASSPFGGYREKYTRARHARGDATAPRGFAARSRVRARLVSLAQIGELARRLSRISHSFFFLFYPPRPQSQGKAPWGRGCYFILPFTFYIFIYSGLFIFLFNQEPLLSNDSIHVKYLSVTYPGEEPQLWSCGLVVSCSRLRDSRASAAE